MKATMILIGSVTILSVFAGERSTNQPVLSPMEQLQAIESIWTNDPVAYFRTVSETFKYHAKSNTTSEGKQAVWTAFTNAIHRPLATDDLVLASTCLGAKMSVLQIYSGEPLHTRQLEEAYLLGEIRSLRAYDPFKHPRYNSWIDLPGHLADRPEITNEVQRAEYLRKADENRRNLDSDEFQRELWSQGQMLIFSINNTVPTFRGKVPDYTNYVNQIAERARLTDSEKQRLLEAQKP